MVTGQAHILSFDVENWFDGNLSPHRASDLNRTDGRLERECDTVLNLLDRFGTYATFFILGTVAERYPDLVRRISRAGHEIGSHSWTHDLARDLTPDRYREGLRRGRGLLQDLTGQEVAGHRAPSWSFDRRTPWAADVLLDAGFTYDSSLFPMRTPLYGDNSFPTGPCWLAGSDGRRILEIPPAVTRFGPLRMPYAGGFYWRALPFWTIRLLLGRPPAPAVTYLHPWELNPEPVDLPPDLPLMARAVLRYGLKGLEARLTRLLQAYRFEPFAAAIPRWPLQSLSTVSLVGE